MSVPRAIDLLVLASLQGALVGLPRPDALAWLGRLRSPAWAAALPGSILIGTFAPLAVPGLATALVVLAVVATVPLAVVAVLKVMRGSRALGVTLGAAALVGAIGAAWSARLSLTILTTLACLAVGAGLARLIPARWMLAGVLGMCAVDVALLGSGVGNTAGALLAHASSHVGGGALTQADVGPETLDYPDLVLAAVLGAFLARRGGQGRAAWLVAALCAGYFLLAPIDTGWPATVPLALALVALYLTRGVGRRWPREAAPAWAGGGRDQGS